MQHMTWMKNLALLPNKSCQTINSMKSFAEHWAFDYVSDYSDNVNKDDIYYIGFKTTLYVE